MNLIIIRHGQTAWNERHRIQGLSDQPLSIRGKRQAELLGKRFAGKKIDAIYTSALKRAIDTGIAIAKHHPKIRLISNKVLNEMDWGIWEGLTFEQIEKRYPKQFAARKMDKFGFAPKKGESPKGIKKRILPFLKRLVRKYHGKKVLIVGHGGINRVMMGILLGWSAKKTAGVFTDNGSVNILHVREEKSRLHLFNCTRHLNQ